MRSRRAASLWRLLPVALAAVASVLLLPLLWQQGWDALPALLVPVGLAAAPLALPHRPRAAHTAAAVLLTLLVLLAAASVGLFYAPAAVAQAVAAVAAWRAARDAEPPAASPP